MTHLFDLPREILARWLVGDVISHADLARLAPTSKLFSNAVLDVRDFKPTDYASFMRAIRRHASVQDIHNMIRNGADLNAQEGLPLLTACFMSSSKIVQLLLDYGADVNAQEGLPLLTACFRGSVDIVQLLLDYGADVDAQEGEPLLTACEFGSSKIVQLLLEKGADVDAQEGEALLAACEVGSSKIVQLLLDKGCDVRAETGLALLHVACKSGNPDIVRRLLFAGADPDGGADSAALSPLMAAYNAGHLGIVQMLLDSGAIDVDNRAMQFFKSRADVEM